VLSCVGREGRDNSTSQVPYQNVQKVQSFRT